jgi:hypothetical protein
VGAHSRCRVSSGVLEAKYGCSKDAKTWYVSPKQTYSYDVKYTRCDFSGILSGLYLSFLGQFSSSMGVYRSFSVSSVGIYRSCSVSLLVKYDSAPSSQLMTRMERPQLGEYRSTLQLLVNYGQILTDCL